ncbi:ribonucleoprotein [Candidatus Bathyarchaeota archaeon]|nr:ribonucleoprotein [Candidatus Bathyarchaeota archaeon]
MAKRPLEVLQRSIDSHIIIRLKDGTEYTGLLAETDNYMNMILSDAKEMHNGELVARFGEIFIRGNNILYIKPDNAIL